MKLNDLVNTAASVIQIKTGLDDDQSTRLAREILLHVFNSMARNIPLPSGTIERAPRTRASIWQKPKDLTSEPNSV